MDGDLRIWVELILQGQRDQEKMAEAKEEEKPSEALIQATEREMGLAASHLGITLEQFASIWKSDMTADQFEKALKKLKSGKNRNSPQLPY